MQELFEPVTENQRLSEKQIKVLHDSSHTTSQAKENQTEARRDSSTTSTIQKGIVNWKQDYHFRGW